MERSDMGRRIRWLRRITASAASHTPAWENRGAGRTHGIRGPSNEPGKPNARKRRARNHGGQPTPQGSSWVSCATGGQHDKDGDYGSDFVALSMDEHAIRARSFARMEVAACGVA